MTRPGTILIYALGLALTAGCADARTDASKTAAAPGETDRSAVMEAMDFFVGSCWDGVFSDGQSTDRHCLRPMNRGQFVRDQHFVDGARGPYGGETIFGWNEAEGRIDYIYFDTSGGRSEGTFRPTDDGFKAPDEVYTMPNGRSMTISSAWIITGADSWEQRTLDVSGDTPKTLWTIAYERAPLGTVEGLE